MEVREATTDDVEGISFFFINSWKKVGIGALGWTGASEETISQISDHAFLSNLLNNDNIRIHLAFKENEITGFSALRISRDCVELSGIIVKENLTGQGVGSKLLETSLQTAKRNGFTKMTVKTETFNERAIGFYKSKGFKEVETVEEEIEGKSVELLILVINLINS